MDIQNTAYKWAYKWAYKIRTKMKETDRERMDIQDIYGHTGQAYSIQMESQKVDGHTRGGWA